MTDRQALDTSAELPPQAGYEQLATELTAMAAAEVPHRAAGAGQGSPAERLAWHRVTARNGDRLAEILAEHGWPVADLVGTDAAAAAFLVAQHADRQLEVQRTALTLLDEAVDAGRAEPRAAAMLRDRVHVNAGQEQVYGTQVAGIEDGAPVQWPVADPDAMDARRASVGLEPWAVHVARFA